MIIRTAQMEDARAMAHVIVDTFLSAHQGMISQEELRWRKEEWTYEVSARNWSEALREIAEGISPRSCIYVAVDESGEVVGLADGVPVESAENTGEIDVLYVRENYQGQGIGRALVQAVAAHLAQMGMTTLHIGVLKANTPARGFYEALGGRVVEERVFEEGDRFPEPGVIYEWTDTRALIAS
jgi:ribosomal protein S18 acetylase RimI-like enzyme